MTRIRTEHTAQAVNKIGLGGTETVEEESVRDWVGQSDGLGERMQSELQIANLSQEEMQQVLRRAYELDYPEQTVANAPGDLDTFIRAAEESGISRESTLQALRERLGHPVEGLSEGNRVFAKSADGFYYVASVVELKGDRATVRFINGGDHTVPVTEIRGFSILPGQKLQVKWPNWGWWTVRVESYNPDTGILKATDGGYTESFTLDSVRLRQESRRIPRISTLLVRVAVIAGGLGIAIGAVLGRLVFH
jgi:hypothetical protein